MREIIFNRFFGTDFYRGDSVFIPGKSDIRSILNKYNIKTFITDERTLTQGVFSEEELDILQLAEIISEIKEKDTLIALYDELKKREDILKPLDFKEITDKVPAIYSKSLIDSLLTVEEVRKGVSDSEPGISYIKEDNVDIFTLNGLDFRIFMHTIGLNNSEIRVGSSELASFDIGEIWKTFEKGVSTISGSVIEPALLESCSSENKPISLGFSTINPDQIAGMGWGDISTSHDVRSVEAKFNLYGPAFKFDYPEELVRKTAAQIHNVLGITKDLAHKYNEVAIHRREVNPDNIKENTGGGRIMPDYVVVYGLKELDLMKAKAVAKAFQKNGEPLPIIQIDLKKYKELGYSSLHRAYQGYIETTPERDSKYIEEIKESVGMRK